MVDVLTKVFELLSKLILILTWRRVALLSSFLFLALVASISAIVLYSVYQNKPISYVFFGRVPDADLPSTINPITESEMKHVVHQEDNIVAISITKVKLQRNERKETFFYSDQADFQKAYEYFLKNKVSDVPLFIAGDESNNKRILGIMDLDMVCDDLPPITIQQVPLSAAYVKSVCSISIPPRFGAMLGYLTLWLKQPVSGTKQSEYKQMMRQMSDGIYDKAN